MAKNLMRGVVVLITIALAPPPPDAFAQPTPVLHLEATNFTAAQLDAMLASIALYRDELLTQILMASAYPLQVVSAARWLEKDDNKSLKGDLLVKALEKENWDPSVKSLVPFPQVIATMNGHLEWMQQLGYAIANQQAAVLNSVQRLRRQAEKAGSLTTTEQQRVVVREETVIIEPMNPEMVYVPVYQPANVTVNGRTRILHRSIFRRRKRITRRYTRLVMYGARGSPLRRVSPSLARCAVGQGPIGDTATSR
jgi:hypothetical protein